MEDISKYNYKNISSKTVDGSIPERFTKEDNISEKIIEMVEYWSETEKEINKNIIVTYKKLKIFENKQSQLMLVK